MPSPKTVPLKKVYAVCFCSMFAGATISPLIALLLERGVPSPAISVYRMLFISVLLVPLTFGQKRYRQALVQASRREWGYLLGYSFAKAGGIYLWAEALSAGGTVFLVNTLGNVSVLFVVLFSWLLLGEKTSPKGLIDIGICFVGVCTVGIANLGQGFGGLLPVTLIVLASLSNSGNSLFGRLARRSFDLLPMITFGYALSGLLCLAVALSKGVSLAIDLKSAGLLLVLAWFSTLIAHSTPTWALKYAKPASVSVINLASPFVTALLGFVLLRQIPSLYTCIGAAIMTAGLAWYLLFGEK